MNLGGFPRAFRIPPLPKRRAFRIPPCQKRRAFRIPIQVVKEQVVKEQVVGAATAVDNSTGNQNQKTKTKTFLIGKRLKTKDLRHTAARTGKRTDNKTQPMRKAAPDSLRAGAGQAATRLLHCATALRVTAPLGCGSRRLVWPKGSPFGPSTRPETPTPLFPRISQVPRIGPEQSRARSGEADP